MYLILINTIFLQDIATMQQLANINVKDVSTILILIILGYYQNTKNTKLELKNDQLNEKMLQLQTDCIKTISSFQETIKENTEALRESKFYINIK